MDQRPVHIPAPEFYGLRVRIGRYQFDHFKQTYARTDDSRPFLAYLNWYIFATILDELRREHWRDCARMQLPSSYRRAMSRHDQLVAQAPFATSDNIEDLSAIVNSVHSEFCKQIEASDIEPGLLAHLTSIQDTISLLQNFGALIREVYGVDVLALLVDGLDHLGSLGRSLAPLLSKDEPFSDRLILKAACRELPRYLYADSADLRLEEGRDYFIVPVGYYDDDRNFEAHLKSVMTNRLRAFLDTNGEGRSIHELVPESASVLYSGFSSIAKFSDGNVLVFLETCALALMREQEKTANSGIECLSPEAQMYGVEQKSSAYFNSDLNYQVGDAADTLRKFMNAFGHLLASETSEPTLAFRVDLDVLVDSSDAFTPGELLAKACEFRYLSVARASFVPVIRRQQESLPQTFELSPTLAPKFGLKMAAGRPLAIKRDNFESRIKAVHGYGHEQINLFDTSPYIFLSISGDAWGKSVKNRISAALQRIQLPVGTSLNNGRLKLVTFQEVSQWKPGRYLDNLIHALSSSQYVIFDVTGGPAPGVVVEIGIASGLRKPHAFCWFGDKPLEQSGKLREFDPQLLPEEVRTADIKVLSVKDAKTKEAFYRWFGKMVHGPCIVQPEMCGFQGLDRTCSCRDVKSDSNKVYVWVQPRNRKLGDSIVRELQRRNIEVLAPDEFGENLSDSTCAALRRAGGAIFDITMTDTEDSVNPKSAGGLIRVGSRLNLRYSAGSRDVLPLIQIGYALGIRLRHACVYRGERGCIKSSMLPVKTSIPEVDLESSVERFIDWFIDKQLGGR
jgi:hypothetical protein